MYEWMPIDCAPQTNRAILLYSEQSKCTFTAYWHDENQEWKVLGGASALEGWNEPTHWMPLPPKPGNKNAFNDLVELAPEMLETLIRARRFVYGVAPFGGLLEKIDEVIEKAKGKL